MKYVYVLLCNSDGTMRSIGYYKPFGVCVTSEEEAKKYVKEGGIGYEHSYEKLAIFETKDEAIKWRFEDTNIPNDKTVETIRKIEANENLKAVDSVDEMIKELES